MTRGSKVAAAVAGSFLALSGSLYGLRLYRGQVQPETTAEPAQQLAQPQPVETTQPPANVAANVPPPAPDPNSAQLALPPAAPPNESATTVIATPPMVMPEVKMPDAPKVDLPTMPAVETKPAVAVPAPTTGDPPQPIDNGPPPAPVVPPDQPKAEEIKVPDPTPMPEAKTAEQPKVEEAKPIVPPPTEAPKPEFKPVEPPPTPPAVNNEPPKTNEPIKPSGTATLSNDPLPTPLPLPDSVAGDNVQPAGGAKLAPKQPKTDSFLEEEYRVQGNENFAAISRRFYFSEKYAPALQQYNRDYPVASAALRQDPPKLSAGTVVWIPPIRILEKRYGSIVPDLKPTANPSNAAAQAVQPINPPASSSPVFQPAAKPTGNPGYKTYRVRDGGESMQDIAQRSLGNAAAWGEILRLNPTLNPGATILIPQGTLLRLPGTAKVE